jgi:RNA polymerase sigma factor (sigma-70 family)
MRYILAALLVEVEWYPMETSVSLLDRLRDGPDEAAWQRLDDIYRPLIRRWLLRDPTLGEEVDDLVQEVMAVLFRELPHFRHERPGSFRRWLRTITVHRLKAFWRSRQNRPRTLGMPWQDSPLAQLEDDASELRRAWDQDHNQHVVRRLLELIEPEFKPATMQAFRRQVFDEVKPAQVAAELQISVNAVLLAKSRILNRLRKETEGLLS